MRIKIVGIVDRGIPTKERLHLAVLAETYLSSYVVFDTIKSSAGVSVNPLNVYWFTPVQVLPGDHVILYTGAGSPSNHRREDGRMNYFYYWNRPTTLWKPPERCAVLLELSDWETSS